MDCSLGKLDSVCPLYAHQRVGSTCLSLTPPHTRRAYFCLHSEHPPPLHKPTNTSPSITSQLCSHCAPHNIQPVSTPPVSWRLQARATAASAWAGVQCSLQRPWSRQGPSCASAGRSAISSRHPIRSPPLLPPPPPLAPASSRSAPPCTPRRSLRAQPPPLVAPSGRSASRRRRRTWRREGR